MKRTFSIKHVCGAKSSFQKSQTFGKQHPEKPQEDQGASLSLSDHHLTKKTPKQEYKIHRVKLDLHSEKETLARSLSPKKPFQRLYLNSNEDKKKFFKPQESAPLSSYSKNDYQDKMITVTGVTVNQVSPDSLNGNHILAF